MPGHINDFLQATEIFFELAILFTKKCKPTSCSRFYKKTILEGAQKGDNLHFNHPANNHEKH
uniref:Putative ovule protein n=1 Tax=Solanum chacoense TaxID=4108 RepID=A0A0V0H4R8_SOLCH